MANIIKELNNTEAYRLISAIDHLAALNTHEEYAQKIYITSDGKYHFSEGNELYELVDLDNKISSEALLLKQGKKQKRILLPGKYISRKPVIKEYSREKILEKKDEIISAYMHEQKALKAKQKSEKGEDDDSPVKVITEALQKLTETKGKLASSKI